ncbi:leucine--tRNA ligase [Candidatus Gracilibacteria bacterium]|nr:leucine--tRNA ligase [Candidatus Gracilibacteria bacterium]MCF7819596.1 leucine--tRNA ligase [Candidatus Gracilibacteria bacterium]
MKDYDHIKIEKKWQEFWVKEKIFAAQDFSEKKKWYTLVEFPYPSGAGLHVGHVRSYAALDAVSRKKRMEGYNVLYPIGWDAFGLPTENYALKTGIHPRKATDENIQTFRRQLQELGLSYDWDREVDTTDPQYYKWTQWIFLKLLEKGLAYKKKMPINWCLSCKIGLANEEVVNGVCERCGGEVEKREKEQWMLAITKYADRLIDDLETVDFLDRIQSQQINWIGKSHGAEIDFEMDILRGKEYFNLGEKKETTALYLLTFNTEKNVSLNEECALSLQKIFRDIARKHNFYIAVGAVMSDHIHLVVADPLERDMEKLMQVIKGSSSKFLKEDATLKDNGGFKPADIGVEKKRRERGYTYKKLWRDGYNFEPIKSASDLEKTLEYVRQNPKKRNEAEERVFFDWEKVTVFTTRPDTLFGATYFVLAPEHPLVSQITTSEQKEAVEKYRKKVATESDLARQEAKEKTGVFTGAYALNPATKEKIPVWIADYVMMGYGTGAIMCVPAHDERDYEFAKKFDLPIREVVEPSQENKKLLNKTGHKFYIGGGISINSSFLNGLSTEIAKEKMIQHLEAEGIGKRQVNYKLRDWVFSRQRYWGEPIPVVHCSKCGTVSLPESELPLELPPVKEYQPTDSGESPLARAKDWVKTQCPKCGGDAERETDTMPNWAGSSWYFLRYIDPHNDQVFADRKKLDYWTPVDLYNGGMEHTTLHLLYSRFWHKFLYDCGYVPTSEPYAKRISHGMILAEDGRKMSKSFGNVINPDDIIREYGADVLRVYEMFMGPFDQAIAWDSGALAGVKRFLDRVWKLCGKPITEENLNKKCVQLIHKSIKKIGDDVNEFKFNTAVSQLMILLNELSDQKAISRSALRIFTLLLSPFAPHMAEEIWQEVLGEAKTLAYEPWPEYDPQFLIDEEVTYAVQVNGKVRGDFQISKDASKEEVLSEAKKLEKVSKYLKEGEIKKEIFVPGKIVGFVVK